MSNGQQGAGGKWSTFHFVPLSGLYFPSAPCAFLRLLLLKVKGRKGEAFSLAYFFPFNVYWMLILFTQIVIQGRVGLRDLEMCFKHIQDLKFEMGEISNVF